MRRLGRSWRRRNRSARDGGAVPLAGRAMGRWQALARDHFPTLIESPSSKQPVEKQANGKQR